MTLIRPGPAFSATAAALALTLTLALVPASCGSDPTGSGSTIASVTLSAPSTTLPLGNSMQLTATVRDVNGQIIPGNSVAYISRSPQLVAVTEGGVVTALAAGSARIVASAGVARDSLVVTSLDDGLAVNTTNQSFIPFSLVVPQGATVRFLIYGIAHNAVFDNVPGAPESIPSTLNQTITRTFSTRGTFPYECTLHPGMTGEIIVE